MIFFSLGRPADSLRLGRKPRFPSASGMMMVLFGAVTDVAAAAVSRELSESITIKQHVNICLQLKLCRKKKAKERKKNIFTVRREYLTLHHGLLCLCHGLEARLRGGLLE